MATVKGMKNLDGKRVRLLVNLKTMGGVEFKAGEELTFQRDGAANDRLEADDGRAIRGDFDRNTFVVLDQAAARVPATGQQTATELIPSKATKDLAARIRGLKRVTIGFSVAYARRNGRVVTIAKGYVSDIVKRLNRALVLLPEAERPELHELSI